MANKVIWSEGMLVGPHHFQQWDHYHEALLDFRLRSLTPFGWGALELTIDRALLESSAIFRVESLCAVFASGVTIQIPDEASAPVSREILAQHFVAPANRLTVYLALPLAQRNGATYCPPGDNGKRQEARYTPDFVRVVDESSGANEQEIVTARKNVRLLLGDEPAANVERFPIAELVKQGGRLTLNEAYIPPCLTLTASTRLSRLLQRLLAELRTKRQSFTAALPQRAAERYEWRQLDATAHWALTLLNGAIAALTHFCQLPAIHPEVVYRRLVELAAQLSLPSVTLAAAEPPPYDHLNLAATFDALDEQIRAGLALIAAPLPGDYTALELEESITARGYPILRTKYTIDNRLLTDDHQYYLAVRADALEVRRQHELLDLLPQTLTVAAHPAIDEYIQFAYGVPLTPALPPAGAPVRPDTAYFVLEDGHTVWQSIASAQALALYMPPEFRHEFKQLSIEFVVLRR